MKLREGMKISCTYPEHGQGNPVTRIGTVVEIRDTQVSPVSRAAIVARPLVKRSRYLITLEFEDGDGRQFYDQNIDKAQPVV